MEFLLPTPAWYKPGSGGHLKSEPEDGKAIFYPLCCSACRQTSTYLEILKTETKICHVKVGVPVLVGPVNCFFGMGSASQCTEQLNFKDLFQL